MHWSEFIGGDVSQTIPYKWQKRFNGSTVTVEDRMDNPVKESYIKQLEEKIPDFVRAYEPDG